MVDVAVPVDNRLASRWSQCCPSTTIGPATEATARLAGRSHRRHHHRSGAVPGNLKSSPETRPRTYKGDKTAGAREVSKALGCRLCGRGLDRARRWNGFVSPRNSSTRRQAATSGRSGGIGPSGIYSPFRPRSPSRSRTVWAAAPGWSRRPAGSRPTGSRRATLTPTNSTSSARKSWSRWTGQRRGGARTADPGGESPTPGSPAAWVELFPHARLLGQFRGRAGAEPGPLAMRPPSARLRSTRATPRRTPSTAAVLACVATS